MIELSDSSTFIDILWTLQGNYMLIENGKAMFEFMLTTRTGLYTVIMCCWFQKTILKIKLVVVHQLSLSGSPTLSLYQ